MAQNEFAPGSMLPKVQAAVKFAESRPGRTALDHTAPKSQRRHPRKDGDPHLPGRKDLTDSLLHVMDEFLDCR
jgi:hypothetical protein